MRTGRSRRICKIVTTLQLDSGTYLHERHDNGDTMNGDQEKRLAEAVKMVVEIS